jgi:hypothetical protein
VPIAGLALLVVLGWPAVARAVPFLYITS